MIITGKKNINIDDSVSKLVNDLVYLYKHGDIRLEVGSISSGDIVVCKGDTLRQEKTEWIYAFNDLVTASFYKYYRNLDFTVNKTYAPGIFLLGVPIKSYIEEYIAGEDDIAEYPLMKLCTDEYEKADEKFLDFRKDLNREVFDREYKDYSKNFIFINHIIDKNFKGNDEAEMFSQAMEYIRHNPAFRVAYSIGKDSSYWEKYENDIKNLLLKTDYIFPFKVSRKVFTVDNFIPYFVIDTMKNKAYSMGFPNGVPVDNFIEKLYEKRLDKGKTYFYPSCGNINKTSYAVKTITGKYFTLGSVGRNF